MSTASMTTMSWSEFKDWVNHPEQVVCHWELDEGRLVEIPFPPHHQAGVKLVWVMDPEESTLQVWRPSDWLEVFEREDEVKGPHVLPSFRCRVDQLFTGPGGMSL